MKVSPFTIAISDARLSWVLGRLRDARWPKVPKGRPWEFGVDVDDFRAFIDYALTGYDWRAQERALNAWPQFTAAVDGQVIHFVYARSGQPDRTTVILNHGWPGSYIEFLSAAERLVHPERHGGAKEDAVDVVIPSLPGYGFSAPPERPIGARTMARLLDRILVEGLGLKGYIAQGGDYGSAIAAWMGHEHAACRAVHLNYLGGWFKREYVARTPEEKEAIERWHALLAADGGYAHVATTVPMNLGYAMSDSPLGAAAWIFARFKRRIENLWAVYNRDELLTNIMVYLLTDSLGSSMWSYRALLDEGPAPLAARVEKPVAVARFPAELAMFPRSYAEVSFNVVRWTEMPAGGHFAAMEQPKLFADDILAFVRDLRRGAFNA
jgi:microsomal epoxide hydrolase